MSGVTTNEYPQFVIIMFFAFSLLEDVTLACFCHNSIMIFFETYGVILWILYRLKCTLLHISHKTVFTLFKRLVVRKNNLCFLRTFFFGKHYADVRLLVHAYFVSDVVLNLPNWLSKLYYTISWSIQQFQLLAFLYQCVDY